MKTNHGNISEVNVDDGKFWAQNQTCGRENFHGDRMRSLFGRRTMLGGGLRLSNLRGSGQQQTYILGIDVDAKFLRTQGAAAEFSEMRPQKFQMSDASLSRHPSEEQM